MVSTAFEENRRKISKDELEKHTGKWVAFSADGSRIVASSRHLEELEKRVGEAGEDIEEVHLTRLAVDPEGMPFGGLELH